MPDPTLDDARTVLRERFGYPDFRPAQRPAVEAVLSRCDALIVLPTGGGKSLCFQVPALLLPGITLVVSPLISLMEDQVQALERRGIPATFLNSTLPHDETARRLRRLERGELKLLYLAPERLSIGRSTELLARAGTSLLAIDEAHCVSRWGHDFRPSYLRLAQVRRALGRPQTVALTATATPTVRRDIIRLLELRAPRQIVGGFDRTNLHFAVTRVRNEARRATELLRHLHPPAPTSVVYAATRRQVESVARMLQGERVRAVGYHAGMPAGRRAAAQEEFMSGRVPVIVATNAFGMGIDKSDVRLVIHVAVSGTLEDYYQEAGRAGRDGQRSRCVLLYHRDDRTVHDRFRDQSFPPARLVRQIVALLREGGAARAPVPAEASALSRQCRPTATAGRAERVIELLAQWELLEMAPQAGAARVRLLALPERMKAAAASLHDDAFRVADYLLSVRAPVPSWIPLSAKSLGLKERALHQALAALEDRQLVYQQRSPPHVRLIDERAAAVRLDEAIESLALRERVERAKLDSMVGYARTRSCRRRYILRYFGQDVIADSCTACDNCRAG